MSILSKIFGDANEKLIKKYQEVVTQINSLEEKVKDYSELDFKNKTQEFKEKLAGKEFAEQQEVLENILPECFAMVREAGARTLNQRHYDVQLLAGIVLNDGNIAEMRTGEGKTQAATLAVYLNALTGHGAHVITVNDYLARRDAVWMGQIYHFLGLSVGCLNHEVSYLYSDEKNLDKKRDAVGSFKIVEDYLMPVERKNAYGADITYGTNNEFGFDYLRDNMVQSAEEKVQRELHFAIVDEVDSILIDEARTPLIISAPDAEPTEKYRQFAHLVGHLKENEDYNIDEKMKAATLTEEGIKKMEQLMGVENIYTERGVREVHHIEQALKAKVLFKKDKDYVIKDEEILIVDEFTGRLMHGRRYSDGLHQAIEAKEGVLVKQESVTMATITFQNYFRMYQKLSGMTGTASTEGEEFAKIYNLDVVIIPTNKPMIRVDRSDAIFKNVSGKYQCLVQEIKKRHEKGQPVLVGTISIENNEYLSELLKREGVPHEILNAKNHEREAEIISQAGREGAVTIATNMAGRGVDIILGGNPVNKASQEKVKILGGLCVLGTERHESRRIDNQLRGRAGRQGDSGETQFFVSMEDDLMRVFGGEKMKSLMQTLGLPDAMPIENKMISNSIEKAQMKVEGHNFDIRKHLVEYDDVINKHREVIYKKRDEILGLSASVQSNQINTSADKLQFNNDIELKSQKPTRRSDNWSLNSEGGKAIILGYIKEEIERVIKFHTNSPHQSEWNLEEISQVMKTILPQNTAFQIPEVNDQNNQQIITDYFYNLAEAQYAELENKINSDEKLKKQFGENTKPMSLIERAVLLRAIDTLWVEHIDAMDHMRTGIGLVGYGQKDPLVEYKNQARRMFQELLNNIRAQVVYSIFKVSLNNPNTNHTTTISSPVNNKNFSTNIANENSEARADKNKVGRNDPCPCGSGLKFKKCHGK
ncbi:MAG TPA: preprotein translocase subunit SecA [bacterium]|nr:preprotein translocase subunit SecA [bacterium]